jgi:hypothetical protein
VDGFGEEVGIAANEPELVVVNGWRRVLEPGDQVV